jgi:uncharacterized protein with HEPN domain
MRDKHLLLKDILIALDRIDSYTRGMNYETFAADEKTVNAVIYNFLVIGEAARLLPPAVTSNSPEIPWRQIAGMRDKLTHAYFSIDYELVWKTVTVVLPQFRSMIQKILEK